MSVESTEADPEAPELLRQGWSAEAQPLDRRRLLTEGVLGLGFLAAAVALALLADADRDFEAVPAVLLVVLFAGAIRVNFDIGAGYTSPVQLVFVPMLLLTPTPLVPLLVAVGWLLGRLPDLRGGRVHADRLLLVLTNSWFAVGPALVLILADAQTPDWDDWPVYLLALAVQFGSDFGMNVLREWIGQGIAPEVQLRVIVWVTVIDAMLAPLGLLAAFAADEFEYAFLLLVPVVGLMAFYGRERSQRLENALALADAARERQELIASASHELVTPLAVLIGLTDRIAPGRPFEGARREQVHAAMSRELVQLRQLVRQFVDYTRLKTERELALAVADTEIRPVVDEVVTALVGTGETAVDVPDGVRARVDPDRLHQMVLGLVTGLRRASPGERAVRIGAREAGATVEVTVDGRAAPPEAPFSEASPDGLGLYVTRELARAQGGDVEVAAVDGGSRYTLVLPRG